MDKNQIQKTGESLIIQVANKKKYEKLKKTQINELSEDDIKDIFYYEHKEKILKNSKLGRYFKVSNEPILSNHKKPVPPTDSRRSKSSILKLVPEMIITKGEKTQKYKRKQRKTKRAPRRHTRARFAF